MSLSAPFHFSWLCLFQVFKAVCRFKYYTALRPLLKLNGQLNMWRPVHLAAPSLPAHASFKALAKQLQPLSRRMVQAFCVQLGRGSVAEYQAAVKECFAAERQVVEEAAAALPTPRT